MYKEIFVSQGVNQKVAAFIDRKIEVVAEKVTNEEQDDSGFMANLHDLCILNRMRESYAGVAEEKKA